MSWKVHAVKYAERNERTRNDSFLMDPAHDVQHDMDYFLWVLEKDGRRILVDTGYDEEEGKKRGRPISPSASASRRIFARSTRSSSSAALSISASNSGLS